MGKVDRRWKVNASQRRASCEHWASPGPSSADYLRRGCPSILDHHTQYYRVYFIASTHRSSFPGGLQSPYFKAPMNFNALRGFRLR
jgi:hypothetical protein